MTAREGLSGFTNCHPRNVPIFRADQEDWSYLYAPGMPRRLPKKHAERIIRTFGQETRGRGEDRWRRAALELEQAARRALAQYDAIHNSRFEPECLTVLISTACPMACRYCFTGSKKKSGLILDEACFLRAARWVAGNCRRTGRDFVLVIHGGGEPTVHMDKVKRFHSLARTMARRHGVGFFSYIATSGLFSEEDAAWLAGHFSQIGLSCDGPPSYQDRQRPRAGGAATSAWVERSARILLREGGRLNMRVTLTPASLGGLESIVRYGKESLGITDIRVEPVYRQSRGGFSASHADRFAAVFLQAQKLARGLGCRLELSGARPPEIHGAYCQIFRGVLQLNPDGSLSSCFLAMDDADPRIIGHARNPDGSLSLKNDVIRSLSRRLAATPQRCLACVNRLHCVRDCPDQCPLENGGVRVHREAKTGTEGFRCRVQKRLAEQWIVENAVLWPSSAADEGEG